MVLNLNTPGRARAPLWAPKFDTSLLETPGGLPWSLPPRLPKCWRCLKLLARRVGRSFSICWCTVLSVATSSAEIYPRNTNCRFFWVLRLPTAYRSATWGTKGSAGLEVYTANVVSSFLRALTKTKATRLRRRSKRNPLRYTQVYTGTYVGHPQSWTQIFSHLASF